MTFASVPVLEKNKKLFAALSSKLFSTEYDARDIAWQEKNAIMIGMGMTEKQGGSDVRTNQTIATRHGTSTYGDIYLLNGHKWFFSAPPLMRNVLCDLAIESEAATILMLHLADAFEKNSEDKNDLTEDAVNCYPAAKFWICKRALALSGEAMEVWG
ncbi:hypothetical protein ACTFIZ_008602 [Dictyostelium cf. discoideum]